MKMVIKYPTTPQMHCYTTLWHVCPQNCNDPELSEAKTLLFKTVAQKYPVYSPNDVSIILFTDETYLQWPHQKNHRMTDCMHISQPRRKMLWQNAHN